MTHTTIIPTEDDRRYFREKLAIRVLKYPNKPEYWKKELAQLQMIEDAIVIYHLQHERTK